MLAKGRHQVMVDSSHLTPLACVLILSAYLLAVYVSLSLVTRDEH